MNNLDELLESVVIELIQIDALPDNGLVHHLPHCNFVFPSAIRKWIVRIRHHLNRDYP